MKILEQIRIDLRDIHSGDRLPLWIDIYDNSLTRKWLSALNDLLDNNLHLEKNYCFLGFSDAEREGHFLIDQINRSIACINAADLGYHINDRFTWENTLQGPTEQDPWGRKLIRHKFNQLHRYFEDLQGVSGKMSEFYLRAGPVIRWHIRQLNLLCHEFECWALSYRKQIQAPEWQRPSQLMCWLNAPRFDLDATDFEYFGIDTLSRDMGEVFLGVNKAIGKHHWEVYQDEGRDSRLDELTTSTLRSQTLAAGDFDIEWGRGTNGHPWFNDIIQGFKTWLIANGFDPHDPNLTIGHPRLGRVDLQRSFGTDDADHIWNQLARYCDVFGVTTSTAKAVYDYHWTDDDYIQRQMDILGGNR